jgi:hypothetical protein
MNWQPASAATKLSAGLTCWTYSKDLDRCAAAVLDFENGHVIWKCHGQEHFRVPSVTRFFILPTKV